MKSKLQKRHTFSTLSFVSVEFLVIVLLCLGVFDEWRGSSFLGPWAGWTLICSLVFLLAMSLAFLRRRRLLAISGLLVFFLATAFCFILPFLFPPATKGHLTEHGSSRTTASRFEFGLANSSDVGLDASARIPRRSVSSER